MKLAFRKYGEGFPLLILHGLFGQSDNWNTLAKQFSEKGFEVFTLDLRNHGLSPHSDEWNYTVMAEDLREFIQEHKLVNPILLGHSLGAKTILFFEYLFPHSAQKIILVDMAAREYTPHHAMVFQTLNEVDFEIVKSRKEVENILQKNIPDYGTRQFLLKNIYWKEPEKLDWRFNLKTITKEYNNINIAVPDYISTTPTLILKGENSNYINQDDESNYQKRFSDYRIITIKNSAHWIHADNPKDFFEAVINFTAT